jgi:hypothetical protein
MELLLQEQPRGMAEAEAAEGEMAVALEVGQEAFPVMEEMVALAVLVVAWQGQQEPHLLGAAVAVPQLATQALGPLEK